MKTNTHRSNQSENIMQLKGLLGNFAKVFSAKGVKKVLLLMALLLGSSGAWGATYYSRATGNWSANATWSTASHAGAAATAYPVAGDVVYIGANIVTVITNDACSSVTFDASGGTLVSNGTLTVSGAIILNNAANADVTAVLNGTGTLNCGSINLGNNTGATNNNTTRTHTISSTLSNLNVTGDILINSYFVGTNRLRNGVFNLTSGNLTVNGSVTTVNANTNNTSSFILGNSSPILKLSGATPFNIAATGTSTTTLNGTGSTVYYDFLGAQTVRNTTYANLVIDGTGTKTLAGATTVSAGLTVNSGCTLNLSTYNLGSPTTTTLYCGATTGSSITGSGTFTLGGGVNVVDDVAPGTDDAKISCPVALGGTRTFTIANDGSVANDLTVSGIVSSANGITKAGLGTMVLSGAVTYTGATTINAGTLVLNQTTSYASSSTTVNAGAFLELTSTNTAVDNWKLNTTLAGAGTINKTGSGWIQTSTNAHTFSGTFNIQAGTFGTANWTSNWAGITADFNISAGALLDARGQSITVGSLQGSGTVGTSFSNNTAPVTTTTVTVGNGNKSGTFNGIILGDGSSAINLLGNPNASVLILVKTGSGTQTLSGANTYTGGTTLSVGTLNINNAQALGASGTFTINGGTTIDNTSGSPITTLNYPQTWNGAFTFAGSNNLNMGTGAVAMGNSRTITTNGGVLELGGVISTGGTHTLTKAGAGALTLSGANIYTGGTNLNAGTLNINNAQALGNVAGIFTVSGGTIDNTSGSPITAINYPLNLTGDFTFTGTNSLNLGAGGVSIGATRQITVSANTLILGGTVTSPTPQTLTKIGLGTLSLGSNAFTLNSLIIAEGTFIAPSNTLNLAGSLTNNGTFTHNSGSVIFNGTIAGTIGGTNPSTFNNVTINRATGLTFSNSQTVNGILTLTNGVLSLSDYNLTLSDAATIVVASPSGTKMIATNSTGSLIKQSTTIAGLGITYPIGTGSFYTPMILSVPTGTIVGTASVSVRAVAGVSPNATSTDLNKYWIVSTSNLSAYTANASFTYVPAMVPTGEANGDQSKYVLRYSVTPSSISNTPASVSGMGVIPMSTTGTTALDGSWTAMNSSQTWYTLKDGNWNDPAVWTLDPAGLIPNNPGGYSPITSPTAQYDNVVILATKSVIVTGNAMTNLALNVQGTLDFGTSIDHSFTTISGNGRIRCAADNFPTGIATDFVTPSLGGGTVEYYGSSYSLSTTRTLNNVEINPTAGQKITLLSNYTLNGNLLVRSGTFMINDNFNTTPLNLIVYGDVIVNSGNSITAGTGNTTPSSTNMFLMHNQFTVYGDFTNNGTVKLTNRTAPDYGSNDISGAVNLVFTGLSDNKFTCAGTTDLNTLQLKKGVDATYVLELYSTDKNNFRLFGINNAGGGQQNKALSLNTGTLKLTGQLLIPTLSEGGGDWGISSTGGLWIAGPNVSVYSTADNTAESVSQVPTGTLGVNNATSGQAMSVKGVFRMTDGYMSTRNSAGFIFWADAGGNAIVMLEGGNCDVSQFRNGLGGGKSSLVMSGGTLTVRRSVGYPNSEYSKGDLLTTFYPEFGLDVNSVFAMSGGQINIYSSLTDLLDLGAEQLRIACLPSNINVTGGKITIANTGNFKTAISSTANLWNLDISRHASAAAGDRPLVILYSDLEVSNNLNITNYATLAATNNNAVTPNFKNLSIGGDLTVSTFGSLADKVPAKPAQSIDNTITFNGTNSSVATFGNKILPADIQNFYRLIVDKPSNRSVTLNAAKTSFVNEDNNLIQVNRLFNLNSGSLNLNNYSIVSYADSIINNGTVTNTDPLKNDLFKFMDKDAVIASGSGASFGNVRLSSKANIVTLNSDTYFKRLLWTHGRANLGIYNLKLDELKVSLTPAETLGGLGSPSVEDMFITSGQASDGGLSILIPTSGNNPADGTKIFSFPLGFGITGVEPASKYTDAKVTISGTTTGGYITANPNNGRLLTTTLTANGNLNYFWRMRSTEFTTQPNIAEIMFKYYDVDASGTGVSTSWVPGKVLDGSPYSRTTEATTQINTTNKTVSFIGTNPFVFANANYTMGLPAAFAGLVKVYYSRTNNNTQAGDINAAWSTPANWNTPTATELLTLTGHESQCTVATDFPKAGDVAIIGYVPYTETSGSFTKGRPHSITINGSAQACAELNFTQMKDGSGNPVARKYVTNFVFRPTLVITNAGANLTTDLVRGEGAFWCRYNNPVFNAMDMGEFARQDSSYVSYEFISWFKTITNSPPLYPNLLLAADGWGANDVSIDYSNNINTNGNLEIIGDANLVLPNGATGDINIGRNLYLYESSLGGTSGGGAQIIYPTSGTARNITVQGDVILKQPTTGAIIGVTSAGSLVNEMHVYGDILQQQTTGGLSFWTGAANNVVNLYLEGNNSMTFTNTASTVTPLNRLIVNKGSSIATTAYWNNDFTLNGATNTATKALALQNGLFIVDNALTDIPLSSGSGAFSIPSTAGLELRQGAASITGSAGLSLDGLLRIGAGSLTMSGNNNSIIYSSSGNALIDINGAGTLTVGGAISRQANNDLGVLKYRQTAGTVLIGTSAINEVTNRGAFEVLNSGSELTFTGGSLTICNQAVASFSTGKASLILNPTTYNLTGSTINIFDANTVNPLSNFGINSSIPLNNLVINNGNGTHKVLSVDHDLYVDGNFTLSSGSNYEANNFDQYFKGDLFIYGTFKATSPNALAPLGTTVNMVGTTNQTITGTITGTSAFYNYTQNNTSNTVNLAVTTPLTINGKLTIASGTFNSGANTVNLKGDFENNGTTLATLGSTGISMNGTLTQDVRGNGVYEILTLDNATGFTSATGSSMTINNSLRMNKGVFSTGGNLIIFNANANPVPVSPYSSTNMIVTNVSISDAGIRKYLTAGATASFIFPLGKMNKYNPIALNVTANTSSTGYFSVNAANQPEPTTIDQTNVLQYYWIFKAVGLTGFSGTTVMNYQAADVALNGHLESEYITARLLSNSNPTFAWNKFDNTKVNTTLKTVTFDFTGVNDDGITGDYTAGVDAAIPANVPTYTSIKNGNWADITAWTPTAPAGGPSGSVVIINHSILMPSSYTSAYKTTINSGGVLEVPYNTPERIGNLDGAGTLKLNSSSFPAGDFAAFMANPASTIDFAGNTDYTILPTYSTYNNVKVSGTGKRYLPPTNAILTGSLTINGTNSTLELRNDDNINLEIKKDLTFTQGVFYAGSSATPKIIFSGSVAQNINGPLAFTGSNSLSGLEINNAAGLSVKTNVDVNNLLSFVNGKIWVGDANSLNVQNSSAASITGANSTNYVDGTLGKQVVAGQSFTFPIGDGTRYGAISVVGTTTSGISLWQAKYFNVGATSAGYNTSSFDASLLFVSSNEYWSVKSALAGTAKVTVRWDSNSGVGNTSADYDDLRQTNWNSTLWTASGGAVAGDKTGTYAAGTVTSNSVLTFGAANANMITIGNVTIPSTINWTGNTSTDWNVSTNWATGTIPTSSKDVVIPSAPASGRYPIINSGLATTKGLQILGANGKLTVASGAKLTIEGALDNQGTLIIQNTPLSMASVKTNGQISQTGVGITRIENTIPLAVRYWYYGFSVNGAGVTSGVWNATDATNTFAYKYESNAYVRFTNNTTALSANPLGGYLNGYSVKRLSGSASGLITTQGTLNNGDLTTTLPASSFGLMCNPYPSSLDMSVVYTKNSANYGTGKIDPTFWVPSNQTGSTVQSTYNLATGIGTNGGTKIIAPTQGYWIRNNNTSTMSFSVNQAARLHATTALKSLQSNAEEDIFRLEMISPTMTDEMVVGFRQIGSLDVTYYDSEKRLNSGNTSCSLYAIKGGRSLAINLLPTIDTLRVVPLGYFAGATGGGEVTLRATNLNSFDSNIEVWLEDKATGQTVNLREVGDVIVTIAAGNSIDRFLLHFKRAAVLAPSITTPTNTGTATTLTPSASDVKSNITITQINNQVVVTINTDNSIDAKIEIITLDGKIVSITNTKYKETRITIPSKQQVYVIHVVNGLDIKTGKIVSQGDK